MTAPYPWGREPVTLAGSIVRLEPLAAGHADGLFLAGSNPEVWKHLTLKQPETITEMRAFVEDILSQENRLCFTVVQQSDNRIVGTSSLFDFGVPEKKLEIGHTWYRPESQRTGVNTECKLLLLTHCFENLVAERVQLKTDAQNTRSRTAILRIGAQFEGVLRHFQARHNGTVRDTAIYSILRSEWPQVQERLRAYLNR